MRICTHFVPVSDGKINNSLQFIVLQSTLPYSIPLQCTSIPYIPPLLHFTPFYPIILSGTPLCTPLNTNQFHSNVLPSPTFLLYSISLHLLHFTPFYPIILSGTPLCTPFNTNPFHSTVLLFPLHPTSPQPTLSSSLFFTPLHCTYYTPASLVFSPLHCTLLHCTLLHLVLPSLLHIPTHPTQIYFPLPHCPLHFTPLYPLSSPSYPTHSQHQHSIIVKPERM